MRVTPEGRHGCADEGGRNHYQRVKRERAGAHAHRPMLREHSTLAAAGRTLVGDKQ
jgi:hypothetical protein